MLTQQPACFALYTLFSSTLALTLLLSDSLAAVVTCDFFLVVVVIAGGQQVSEDQSRDVHLLLFVLHYGDSFPVVPYGDGVRLPDGPQSHTTDKSLFI